MPFLEYAIDIKNLSVTCKEVNRLFKTVTLKNRQTYHNTNSIDYVKGEVILSNMNCVTATFSKGNVGITSSAIEVYLNDWFVSCYFYELDPNERYVLKNILSCIKLRSIYKSVTDLLRHIFICLPDIVIRIDNDDGLCNTEILMFLNEKMFSNTRIRKGLTLNMLKN